MRAVTKSPSWRSPLSARTRTSYESVSSATLDIEYTVPVNVLSRDERGIADPSAMREISSLDSDSDASCTTVLDSDTSGVPDETSCHRSTAMSVIFPEIGARTESRA